MISKQDFMAIARAVRMCKMGLESIGIEDCEDYIWKEELIDNLVVELKHLNGDFQESLFREACE